MPESAEDLFGETVPIAGRDSNDIHILALFDFLDEALSMQRDRGHHRDIQVQQGVHGLHKAGTKTLHLADLVNQKEID